MTCLPMWRIVGAGFSVGVEGGGVHAGGGGGVVFPTVAGGLIFPKRLTALIEIISGANLAKMHPV